MLRNRATLFTAVAIAVLSLAGAYAQEGAGTSLSIAGKIEAGLGLAAGEDFAFEDPAWTGGSLSLTLTAEARPSDGLRIYTELRAAEGLPLASPGTLAELSLPSEPSFTLVEAWAALQDAPIPGTELRLGRQRIAWGPADEIGIVDAFDAPDFTNLSAFGEKLASDAIRLRYFGDRFGLDLAWSPFWRAPPLPADIPAALMPSSDVSIPGMTVTPLTPDLTMPGTDPCAASTFGGRITWEPSGWTFGALYVYGRSATPAPYKIVITPTSGTTATAASYLEWPRRHQAAVDLAGELFGVGVWAEGALIIPDRTYTIDLSNPVLVGALGGDRSTSTDDDPYWRWLLGCDYTFKNDLYLNFQYLRGMGWENLPDSQNDYAVLALKWELAGGRFVLGPLAAVLELDTVADIVSGDRELKDSIGAAISPSISYKPYDGVELTAGLAWMLGSESTTLGAMSDASRLDFRTTISF